MMTSPADPASWLMGFIPELPTPFDESGAIDLKAFETLCERQIAARVPALVVCDIAGEASTLSPDRVDIQSFQWTHQLPVCLAAAAANVSASTELAAPETNVALGFPGGFKRLCR